MTTIEVADTERPSLSIGIEKALLLSGLSKQEFARRVGASPATLNLWIKGITTPTPARLARIANKCGVDQEWLRNGGRDENEDES